MKRINMRKILLSSVLGLSLMTMSAMGQETQTDTRMGAGVAFDGTGSAIKVPIDLDTIRIEPELSWSYVDTDKGGSNNNFYLGSGVYLLNNTSNDISLYYGGKFGIRRVDTGVNSDTVLELAGIVGVEYFMHKQISLGGEVGLGLGFGDDTDLGTQTAVTLRYYFQN